MSLKEYFIEYKEECELSYAQNKVECDLYSLIAYIIRVGEQGKNISLRDVSVRRTSKISKRFKSESGFPDFIIMKREKKVDAAILGAIEAKYMTKKLEDYMTQVNDHIKSYGKVIYTNGIVWRFYDSKESEDEFIWEIPLGEIKEGKIIWYEDEKWNMLIEKLDSINWEEEVANR